MTVAGWRAPLEGEIDQSHMNYLLVQGSAAIFCTGPDAKCTRLCGPYSLCHSCPVLLLQRESSHRRYTNEGVCVLNKTFEFSCVTKYYYTFSFFQLFNNVKTTLSSLSVQNRMRVGLGCKS